MLLAAHYMLFDVQHMYATVRIKLTQSRWVEAGTELGNINRSLNSLFIRGRLVRKVSTWNQTTSLYVLTTFVTLRLKPYANYLRKLLVFLRWHISLKMILHYRASKQKHAQFWIWIPRTLKITNSEKWVGPVHLVFK